MILQNFVQKFFYKLFPFFLSVFCAAAVHPASDAPVKPSYENVKMSFVAVADPQISNYMFKRYPVFTAAMEDLHNSSSMPDAVVIAGDIAENGLAEEYQLVFDKLSGLDTRYILAEGNHDIRLRVYSQSLSRFSRLANELNGDDSFKEFNYTEKVNGYKFVVLGSEKTDFEESKFSDERLKWLENEIKAEDGNPVFVVAHQPLKNTHGLPDTWNSPFDSAGSVGKQSDKLLEILSKYKNVILITGHLHTGIGEYTHETLNGLEMVNLPSLCIENKDGEYNDAGIGFVVEVYSGKVLFRARDFAKGKWLSELDFSIPLK